MHKPLSHRQLTQVKRRRWNNEQSLSVTQEVHEYGQWAKQEGLRMDNKRSKAAEKKCILPNFPIGTHTRFVYHSGGL